VGGGELAPLRAMIPARRTAPVGDWTPESADYPSLTLAKLLENAVYRGEISPDEAWRLFTAGFESSHGCPKCGKAECDCG